VLYTIHGDLTFQTTPDDALSQVTLSSPAVNLKYLPLVPTSIPQYPVIEMAQVMDPYSPRQLFKAAVESPQRGVCPGMVLLTLPALMLCTTLFTRRFFFDGLMVHMRPIQARSAWTFVIPLSLFVAFVPPTMESHSVNGD
jgi:hypothetical protein